MYKRQILDIVAKLAMSLLRSTSFSEGLKKNKSSGLEIVIVLLLSSASGNPDIVVDVETNLFLFH